MATGGLFGGLGTASTTSSGGGLFGSLMAPSSKPAQSGGLFGGLSSTSTTSTPQQAGTTGAFGGLGQGSSTAGASTFGGSALGGGASAPSGGLFGQPQQQKSSGLFGATGGNTQQNGTGNVGGLGLGQSTQPQQQQQQGLAASQGPLQQSTQNGQNHAYFDSILEKSRKRAYGESAGAELPQLQLGLSDLRQRIKRLGSVGPDRNVDGKAHYLLAGSGVDPGAAVRDLTAFNATSGKVDRLLQQPQQIDTDVEGYLANLQTQTTLSMISDGLARSVRDFDSFLEDNVTMEWDAQRKKIYQHFGIKPREDLAATGRSSFQATATETTGGFGRSRKSKAAAHASSRGTGPASFSTFGRSSMQKSAIGAPSSIGKSTQQAFADVEKQIEKNGVISTPGDRFQRDKQSKYAEKIQSLNVARLEKRFYPIATNLAAVVTEAGEQHGPDLVKAYRALIEIVSENPDVELLSDPLAVAERKFAKIHLDDDPKSQRGPELRKRIMRGGARCFEKLAFEEVEAFISKNPREANLGGVPNVISKVKAYVRLLASKKNLSGDNNDLQMLGDDYVWALIYYLLRTGHVQEIVDYVAANAVAFRAIDRNFTSYITEYFSSPDRRLRRDLQERINSEYSQRLRIAPENSIDPYRMACYKIIGRCDLKSRNIEGISHTVEDFVWLQLVLAREVNKSDDFAGDAYGLAELQKTMKEIGSRFFEKGGTEVGCSFGSFVFFQVACGMFEQAVSYLYPFSYTDAVHLAIALNFYGLLRASDPNTAGEDLLSYTTREAPQINFGRLIGYYTRDFRAANVTAAVDYLVLICLNKDIPGQSGSSQVTLCHEALREIVLESREFALLLGDLLGNGERHMGVIEQRMGLISLDKTDDFMRMITIQAASIADDNGRLTDAVLLYHLAGEYNNVMVILNRALSEFLVVPVGQDPLRLQTIKMPSNPSQQQIRLGSLSLTSIDDPQELSHSLMGLYMSGTYENKMRAELRNVNMTLTNACALRILIENGQWTTALDAMSNFDLIPINAKGEPSMVRKLAKKFPNVDPALQAIVPNLISWAVQCGNGVRATFMNSEFSANIESRQTMLEQIKRMQLDMISFTSQLRYRFPAELHELLAEAQSSM
ncbi:hypothetical protein HYFRA_00004875 [Hymenoscyphus fraxineus]|uniref:Nucleoporin-interacting protein NIC96 n=1 Tax=Hymenoscyphus fraxineus TaxID=746836 RepID=A0A9N9PMS6_9HELO|nr:hypothetical protein HYFRA_00004875 [Hymenoscyphus fraxineus]